MKFIPTPLMGAYIIELEPNNDHRGFFARAWCQREFTEHGLNPTLVQSNLSWNPRKGTLRGMHYQLPPHSEDKLVRAIRGAVYDAIVDLRPGSPTFLQWTGAELTADNRRALYVPKGFGHGFLTLVDESEVMYQVTEFFYPELARSVRYNDPLFGIQWPGEVQVIIERDATCPLATPADFEPFRLEPVPSSEHPSAVAAG